MMAASCLLGLSLVVAAESRTDSLDLFFGDGYEESWDEETEIDDDQRVERWEDYRRRPLALNTATEEELGASGFFSPLQLANFCAYRREMGPLVDLSELLYIKGFDANFLRLIAPYVGVQEKPERPLRFSDLLHGQATVFLRSALPLQRSQGYQRVDSSGGSEPYLGSPLSGYLRVNYAVGSRLKAALVAEKDAGEVLLGPPEKRVTPHLTGYLSYSGDKLLRQLTLGNYQMQWGQGLALWTGMALSPAIDGMANRRRAVGIRPYASAAETGYLRGLAATLGVKKIEVSLFVSARPVDGTLVEGDSSRKTLSSLSETGYYRTPAEKDKRHVAHQYVGGAYGEWRFSSGRVGLGGHVQHYDALYRPEQRPYQRLLTPSWPLLVGNIDAEMQWRSIRFFGEAALSRKGSYAYLLGTSFQPDPRFFLQLQWRDYDESYANPLAQGPGKNSATANERGWTMTFQTDFSPQWSLAFSHESYTFPFLSFAADAPIDAVEQQIRCRYVPSSDWSIYALFRWKSKPSNASDEQGCAPVLARPQINLRLQAEGRFAPSLSFKTRVEALWKAGRKGLLVFQDVRWQSPSAKWIVQGRFAVFDTDSYDERIYAHEPDVLYAYSSKAYMYKGCRSSLVIQYTLGHRWTFWLKTALTHLSDRYTQGSGREALEGRDKGECRLQLRWKINP